MRSTSGNAGGDGDNGDGNDAAKQTTQVKMDYDELNRMTMWQSVGQGGTTVSEETIYRGAEWHRASTIVDGVSTNYLYDGDNVLADYVAGTGGGTLTFDKLYVTPFLDQNLSMTDSNSNHYYYSQDGLGSVRTLTNNSGVVENNYDYTAFGEKYTPNTTTNIEQRYTYTSREKTAAPSLMYYRYRIYNASTGRFTARGSAWI